MKTNTAVGKTVPAKRKFSTGTDKKAGTKLRAASDAVADLNTSLALHGRPLLDGTAEAALARQESPLHKLLTGLDWFCYVTKPWRKKMLAEDAGEMTAWERDALALLADVLPVTVRKTGVTPPLRISPALPGKLQKRLDAAVKGSRGQADAATIIRQGVHRMCLEWEAEGSMKFGTRHMPPAKNPALIIRPKYAKILQKCARLLEVDPQRLTDWTIGDACTCFTDKGGMLVEYADGMLVYPSDKERERVQANVNPYRFPNDLARRKREAAGAKKASKKGGAR